MNPRLCEELLALKQRDLDTRTGLAQEGRLYNEYAAEMQQVHRENAIRLNELVDQYGWPGVALVGIEGSRAAWLIAQHSICTPDLQRKFLALLTTAADRGDVPKAQMAMLTDRVRFNEGKPQVYGTVVDWNDRGELACEVEDAENLNERRRAVGLPPFEEALREHRREVDAEGGKPPADLAEYRRRGQRWAEESGWR